MLLLRRGQSWIAHAPAKLNLFLEVLGKRSDGFHELETLMVTVALYDTLVFQEGPFDDIRLTCRDAVLRNRTAAHGGCSVPTDRDNLVVQAAHLLRAYAGVSRGVRIELHKRIPVAAGLAGGSSDAAATLLGLSRLWNVPLSRHEMGELAARLGSDVPFFLAESMAAVCRGRGEFIEPIPLPAALNFIILRPGSGLSTREVYERCRPAPTPQTSHDLTESLTAGHLGRAGQLLYNALSSPAEQINPEVNSMRRILSKQPILGHSMSGSGTACFGLCASWHQARNVARRLAAMRLGRVFVAQSRP